MISVWLVVGVVVFGVVAKTIASSYARTREPDLGSVSHRWVAERRLEPPK